MSDHRPMFTISPERRPLRQRLTPLAWALIGATGVALALLAMLLGFRLADGLSRGPWSPTTVPTVVPQMGATEPASTPTAVASQTLEVEFPAWWATQMTQDGQGKWWAPEEVAGMVRHHYEQYIDALRAALVESIPPNYDALEQVYTDWNSGSQLDGTSSLVADFRVGLRTPSFLEWEVCVLQVQEWSEDGLECTLGITCQGGTFLQFDHATGELLGQEEREQSGLILMRMRYDPYCGRWKQHEFLELVPWEE